MQIFFAFFCIFLHFFAFFCIFLPKNAAFLEQTAPFMQKKDTLHRQCKVSEKAETAAYFARASVSVATPSLHVASVHAHTA